MEKDAAIIRMGPGATPGTTRVRYAAPQLSSGGSPFLTVFELPDADYALARAAFVRKEDEAKHTVEQLKKDLGEKRSGTRSRAERSSLWCHASG
jgi:hypothetical protein